MTFITQIALCLIIAAIVHWIFNFLRARARILQTFALASIPGPSPSFFTGNYPEYLKGPHEALDRWVKEYGPVYGYFQGSLPILVLSDLDDVHEVLIKLGTALPNRQRAIIKFEPFVSSLIQQRGVGWKRSRRILTPAFTAHKIALNTTKTVINESVGRFLGSIDKLGGTECFKLNHAMNCLLLDIITRLAFNMDPVDIYAEHCELRELAIEFLEHSSNFPVALTAYLPITEKIFRVLFGIFGGGKLVSTILTHLEKCIKEYEKPSETKVNILDFMLEQRQNGHLNETELMGNAILVLLAGYETSAASLMFTFYLLAKHSDVQEKLREELVSIRDESGEAIVDACFYDEHKCDLLDRVWYEAMRLYTPVITFVTRELDENQPEVTLTKSGVKITHDMTVQIPVNAIHHNPTYWSQPYKFNPYRKNLPVDGLSSTTPTSAFLTFGAGIRNCVGRFLALSEARAVISSLVLRYRLELAEADEVEPVTGLLKVHCHTNVLHPEKEIRLKLTPIEE